MSKRRGTPTSTPLISACLIVRNEAVILARCLDAVRGVADEIVVYDTGSTDGTIALARAHGARVVEGQWHDDFALARNAALAACRGTWVLHVDADDVLTGDGGALRRLLRHAATDVDAFLIEIENLVDDGTGRSYTNRACRVFRRDRGRWQGRIHEQVVASRPARALRTSPAALPVRLLHSGYLGGEMERQDKVARNVRIAEAALAETAAGPDAELLLDLGRSLKAAGRLDEAVARCLEASEATTDPPVAAAALLFAVSCLLGLGQIDEARRAITSLRATSTRASISDFLEAQAHLQAGEADAALALLDGIDDLEDDNGKRLPNGVLALHRGMALAMADRWQAAADAFAEAIGVHGAVQGNLGLLVDALGRAGRPIADLAAVLHPELFDAVLLEAPELGPDEANIVCRALWERVGSDARLVAAVAGAAPVMGLELALEWALRLRASGVDDPCTLLALSADDRKSPSLRVYAGATVVALDDRRGLDAIRRAAPGVPEAMFTQMLVELNDLAPASLPVFVEATAATARRAFVMGQSLHALGAEDEAMVLVESALAGAGDAALAGEVVSWLNATVSARAATTAAAAARAAALAAARGTPGSALAPSPSAATGDSTDLAHAL
jgi:tetratricopeptide (TPR) repeat protein